MVFNKRIIQLVSFFLYSGYYIGISCLFALGLSKFSKYYSIPLRIFLVLIMLYYIKINFRVVKKNIYLVGILISLAFLYILKVLYTENIGASQSRGWGEYIFYFISYCIIPFFFYLKVDIQKYKKDIINPIVLSGLIVAALNVVLFKDLLLSGGIGRISDVTRSTNESIISPLALSYSSAITISLIIYKLVYEKKSFFRKVCLIVGVFISSVIFFMGSTRGALLAIFISLLVILYFSDIKKKLYISIITILSIPVFIFISQFTGSSLFERTSSAIEEGDTSGRDRLWQEAFLEFYNYPLLGGRTEVSGIYPHNIFLEILMSMGIIGFVFFIIICINSFHNVRKYVVYNNDYVIPVIIFANGLALHLVSGSFYTSILIFAALGMMNSKTPIVSH